MDAEYQDEYEMAAGIGAYGARKRKPSITEEAETLPEYLDRVDQASKKRGAALDAAIAEKNRPLTREMLDAPPSSWLKVLQTAWKMDLNFSTEAAVAAQSLPPETSFRRLLLALGADEDSMDAFVSA